MLLAISAYVVTLVIFVALDMVWLSWIGGPAYRAVLGEILLQNVRIGPAIIFYLGYPLGLALFAVPPNLGGGSISQAMMRGALFGLFTYATYDLTNMATLKNWTWGVTLMDIGWGCVLGGVAAAAAAAIVPLIGGYFGAPGG